MKHDAIVIQYTKEVDIGVVYIALLIPIVGLSSVKKYDIELGKIYAFGLVHLILAIYFVSNLIQIGVSRATFVVGLFSIGTVLLRWFLDPSYRRLVDKSLYFRIFATTFVLVCLSILLKSLNFDYAAQNFDAYYAIQDANFLKDNPVSDSTENSSLRDASELLPLNWSASTVDRYGPSFLLAALNIFNVTNLWSQAQYLAILFLIINVMVIQLLLKKIGNESQKNLANLVGFGSVVLSPFFLMQWQYFMYGQMLAIPILILLVIKLGEFRFSGFDTLQVAVLNLFLFICYPAIFFISFSLSIISIAAKNNFSSRNIPRLIKMYYQILFTFVFLSLLLFVGSLSNPIKRFLVWFITNTDRGAEHSWESIQLFSQFTSKISIPLWFGMFPYPYLGTSSFLIWIPASIAAVLTLVYFYKMLLRESKANQFTEVFLILMAESHSLLALAFFLNKPYLIVKILVWLMPVTSAVFFYLFIRDVKSVKIAIFRLNLLVKVFPVLLVTALSVGTSGVYLGRTLSWTNFPQIIKPNDYALPGALISKDSGKIALLTPTTEEGIWFAGQLSKDLSTKIYNLSASGQSLGLSMSRECKLSRSQRLFADFSSVVFNHQTLDNVMHFEYVPSTTNKSGSWRLIEAKNLIKSVIIQGYGVSAPWIKSKNQSPLIGSSIIRWSSSQICIGVYSDEVRGIELSIPILIGPDLLQATPWKSPSAQVQFSTAAVPGEGLLRLKHKVPAGWSTLQVIQPGCFNFVYKDRWRSTPDDRRLCFAIGSIDVKWN